MAEQDITAYIGLGADVNKQKGDLTMETQEGVVSDKLSELDVTMSNEDILKLTKRWEAAWNDSAKKSTVVRAD